MAGLLDALMEMVTEEACPACEWVQLRPRDWPLTRKGARCQSCGLPVMRAATPVPKEQTE